MCNYKTLLNRYVPTSTYKSVKNYAIDLWKIIFEFFIIFHHFMGSKNGGSFVEFYFLISGYLLCNSYYKNKNQSIYLYMKKRIKTFWPTYLLAFIIIYLVKIGFTFNIDYLPEAFMLQGLGFYSINYPMWYLSVLLLITPLILLFLKYYHEKSFNYFAVIIIALVYFNMLKAGLETWDLYGIYYTAWWRGFADMLIGVLIFKFTKFLSEKEYKSYKIFFNILEILSSLILIAIFYILFQSYFKLH